MIRRDQIYFAASGGRIKIGIAFDVNKRLRSIETHLPEAIVLLGTTPGSVEAEREIHRRLEIYKLRNEWFRDCAEVRNEISKWLAKPVRDWIFVGNARCVRPQSQGVRSRDPEIDNLMDDLRKKWPEKTAEHMAHYVGASVRACKYWLKGRCTPSYQAVSALMAAVNNNSCCVPRDMTPP